ncbi:hypothetical protein NIES4071_104830 (plasmid) [Calothrix sp. NIES-4071]|nr:hypothetical protein NIES4071_104830 [Calothrix sp. NIES-4071]BAZ64901.1 hypothetical protein NIES4105_106340 [Calothrix sp. NIES-4105]
MKTTQELKARAHELTKLAASYARFFRRSYKI